MKMHLEVTDFDVTEGGEVVSKAFVTLRAYEELVGEIGALKQDMLELRNNRALLDAEVVEIATIRAQHRKMMDEQNEIALFLRDHYRDEIALGQHGGMTLVQVVEKYLGRERMMKDRMVRTRPTRRRASKSKKSVQ